MNTGYFKPRHNPWIIAVTVTLATIMEVLDTSIANVALPHIAGALGSSHEESTWVITSYLVSNAVILPVASYFATLVGRKRFYMACVAIFGISSILCGFATSLPMLLFFRILQGLGGGGLAPSEQSILADTFPPEKRGQAFAVYGLAVITAPVLGPTLGGWITDNYNWRWIFFINVPIACLSLFLTSPLVEDPPHIRQEVKQARQGGFKMDGVGFGFIALAFGCLEVVIDKGQEDDWFGSNFIVLFTILTVIGFVGTIVWESWIASKGERPILDLRLFRRRTFVISFLMMAVVGFSLYGTSVMLPQILQQLMGYTAEKSGVAMSTGGLATMIAMPLVGILITRVDPRKLVMLGFASIGLALLHMTNVNLAISFGWAAQARFLQSFGLGLIFVPVSTLAYVGTSQKESNDVSGLTNLARNVGGSLGTAFVTTFLARWSQVHQTYLSHHVNNSSPAWTEHLQQMTQQALGTLPSEVDARHQAIVRFYQTTFHSQAQILAYIDIIQFFAVCCLAVAPLALLMKRPPKDTQAAMH